MAQFYVNYRDADGQWKWMPVEAPSADAARRGVEAKGFEVGTVAPVDDPDVVVVPQSSRRQETPASSSPGAAWQPEPVRPARPLGQRVGEMTPRDFGWLITKHVVIALAIWWVISLVLGLMVAAMFGVAFSVGG